MLLESESLGPRKLMILNVYALLFVKHQYTGDVGLPPAVCVLDLKKKRVSEEGESTLCYEKD